MLPDNLSPDEIKAKLQQVQNDVVTRRAEIEQAAGDGQATITQIEVSDSETKQAEHKQNRIAGIWEKVLSIIPVLVALLTPMYSMMQLSQGQMATQKMAQETQQGAQEGQRTMATSAQNAAVLQSRAPFIAERMELYENLVELSGTLVVTDTQRPAFAANRQAFERLYWTKLPLAADKPVQDAADSFRAALKAVNPQEGYTARKAQKARLAAEAQKLSAAVRASLLQTYDATIPLNAPPQTETKADGPPNPVEVLLKGKEK